MCAVSARSNSKHLPCGIASMVQLCAFLSVSTSLPQHCFLHEPRRNWGADSDTLLSLCVAASTFLQAQRPWSNSVLFLFVSTSLPQHHFLHEPPRYMNAESDTLLPFPSLVLHTHCALSRCNAGGPGAMAVVAVAALPVAITLLCGFSKLAALYICRVVLVRTLVATHVSSACRHALFVTRAAGAYLTLLN